MKKLLISASTLALGMFAFVNAQTLPSISELLQDAEFWFGVKSPLDVVSVYSIDETKITLTSPIILDVVGEYVQNYRVTYAPHLMEDLAIATAQSLLDSVETVEFTIKSGDRDVMMPIGIYEGLEANTTYYAIVTPIDSWDEFGTSSEQICFNLSEQKYEMGDACLTFEEKLHPVLSVPTEHSSAWEVPSLQEHAAAKTDMTLANVTHTVNNNTVTLRWTAVDGAEEVDIFVFNIQQEKYIRVATVRMTNERYDYVMTWDGEHIFRFVPLDGGKEIVYNMNAMRAEEKETPPVIEKIPETGPVENTLIILVLSLLAYGGYKYYIRSREI